MDVEIKSLSKLCLIVAASLSYCYAISSRTPKGMVRLLSFLPVVYIFVLLPFLLSSVMLRLIAGICIAWIANFKLFLLALYPNDSSSKASLLSFILTTALPIKMKQAPDTNFKNTGNNLNSPTTFLVLVILWCFVFHMYVKKPYKLFPEPIGTQILFTLRILINLQLWYTVFGVVASKLLKHELEPQFSDPHLSSSLQNFWGMRWNRVNSSVLRTSIYTPIRAMFEPVLGRRWSRCVAIVTTFVVSGLMHEMVYMYAGLEWPTWEVTWFFLINGLCVAIEIEVKQKASEIEWVLHPMISRILTVGFITITGARLCCAELVHCGTHIREIEEYVALLNYVKNVIHI